MIENQMVMQCILAAWKHLHGRGSGPLCQAAVTYGRLVRTQFLYEYFSDMKFRNSIRRALNRGESMHQLQRSIRPYVIAPKRGRSLNEQRSISDLLSLPSNSMMTRNTQKIQEFVDKPDRHNPVIGVSDISFVGLVATSHINFRGFLNFPIEEFTEPILRVPVAVPTGR